MAEYPNMLSGIRSFIGSRSGSLWGNLATPTTAAIARPLVGAGVGYGLGAAASAFSGDDEAKRRTRRNWAMMGAGAGAVASGMDLSATGRAGMSLTKPWPSVPPRQIWTGDQPQFPGMPKTASKAAIVIPVRGSIAEAARELQQKIPKEDLHRYGKERDRPRHPAGRHQH
jgi:hypothetical protein